MAITVEMRTQVSELYVALFGRAPDGEGLGFWTGKLNAGESMAQVADEMYATAPARDYYPSFLTNAEIIESFYVNVLGRPGDAGGLAYWTAKLNTAGATPGTVIAEMIHVVANYTAGGGIDPDGLISEDLFNNRTEVAQWYGENNGSIAGATAILSGVTDDHATVDAAEAGGTIVPGVTIVLTTEQNVVTASGSNTLDIVKGTVNYDGTTNLSTFGQADSIVGNGHTAVQVTVIDTNNGAYSADYVDMSGVDAFKIVAATNDTVTFDASSYGTDISLITLSGQDGLMVNFSSLAADSTLEISMAGATTGTFNLISATQDGISLSASITDADDTGGGDNTLSVGASGINVTMGHSGNAWVSLSQTNTETTGASSVGDITVGDINMNLASTADVTVSFSNRASNTGSGTATAGSVTVGDVSMVIGTSATAEFYINNSASIDIGDATVGDVTVGNVDVFVAKSGSVDNFTIYNSASAQTTGNATAGNITLGDFNIDMAESANIGMYLYVYNYAYANNTGDATVGDTSMGDIVLTGGDNISSATFNLSASASADTGDAKVGNMTVGDISANIGDYLSTTGTLNFTFEQYASADVGDATVGNITVGDVDITVGNSQDANLYVTNSATVSATGSAHVGATTVGDVNFVGGTDAYMWYEVDITASGTTGDTVGTTTIGNIDMYGGASADVNFSLNITADNGDVGDVTIGDIEMVMEDSGSVFVSIDITGDTVGDVRIGDIHFHLASNATIDTFSIDVSAQDGDISSFTLGDVSIIGANDASDDDQGFNVYAYDDILSITLGNVTISADVGASFSSNTWTFEADNGSIGDITVGDINLIAASSAYVYYELNFSAEDNIGDVTFGDVSLSAIGGTAGSDVTVSYSNNLYNSDDIGDIIYGDISLSASGSSAQAFATFTASNDGLHDIGNITMGDVTLNAKNGGTATTGASATLSMSYSSADIIGTVTIGDINVALSQTADATQNAYAEFDLADTSTVNGGGDIVIGNITLTAGAVTDLFNAAATVSAWFSIDGESDVTIGDITVIGGGANSATPAAELDNFASLLGWLDIDAGGDITVGDIDYSGYQASATIDVSNWKGAANIKAAQDDTIIYDNVTKNVISLGAGDDEVILDINATTGKANAANIDQIKSFENGNDLITIDSAGTTINLAGIFATYALFLAGAEAGDQDAYIGRSGGNTFVAFDVDNDDVVDFVIELVGVTNIGTGDINIF